MLWSSNGVLMNYWVQNKYYCMYKLFNIGASTGLWGGVGSSRVSTPCIYSARLLGPG